MKIAIAGCAGRMGTALIKEVLATEGLELVGGSVRADSTHAGMDLGEIAGISPLGIAAKPGVSPLFTEADVVIDFTTPELSMELIKIAGDMQKKLVIGTTGFSDKQLMDMEIYSESATIIYSRNMAIGVNMFVKLVEQAAQVLDESFDIEIVEMHHRHKVDAPSGTAMALGEAAAKGRGVDLANVASYARNGRQEGGRPAGTIGFAALRGGDVVGEHTVVFAGEGERLELKHTSTNREIFAQGAVRAAVWSKDQEAGLYSMRDVLGL